MVTNSTLYALLQTVHSNQTQIIMPGLASLLAKIAALDGKLIALDAKLDAIIRQVTPPETGDFNPQTAKVS